MYQGVPIFEILGDATEARTQFPFYCSFCYLQTFENILLELFDHLGWQKWKEIILKAGS
ncbi:MAG: hypothetical protein ACTSYI_10885 [Promethearchaeota archaeon]